MTKDYRGGRICPGERVIQSGETVRINASGREGKVVDRIEGSYAMAYFVVFPGDPEPHRIGTDELTPAIDP